MRETNRRVLLASIALTTLVVAGGCESDGEPSAGTDAGFPTDDAGAARPDAGPPARTDAGPPLPRYAGLPVSCWLPPNSLCNPANNEGCPDDEACDLGTEPGGRHIIACFPPPAAQQLGEACDNEAGPFCRGGLRCMDGECMDTCCGDDECTVAGERCVPLAPDLGTLGVCRDSAAPMCQPPGGSCRSASDCCSRDCHIDHCH
jgi:hypothetical protein